MNFRPNLVRVLREYRLIAVPAAILAGLVLLLGVIEYGKSDDIGAYQEIIADPIPALGRELEKTAWSLGPKILAGTPTDEALKDIAESSRLSTELLKVLRVNAFEAEEHKDDIDKIRNMDRSLQRLREAMPSSGLFREEDMKTILSRVADFSRTTYELNTSIIQTHKHEVAEVMEKIQANSDVRSVLQFLILLGGAAFIVVLWDSMRHYKENAERAHAAERVNALFAAALESTRVGVLIRDMRAQRRPVVFINRAFTELTGYEYSDAGEGSSEFLFGYNTDQASIAAYRKAITLHENRTLNLMLYRKNGQPFWSEWHLSPVLSDDGSLTHYVSLFTDTTALRRVQDELLEAKQMAEHGSAVKTNFLAMMSHEIRTPINGILGVLKLVAERPLDDEQRHLLSIAMTSSQALHGIINDILDFAKIEAGKVDIFPEVFNIRALVDEVSGLGTSMIGGKPVIVETAVDDNLSEWLRGDEGRVRQLLLNLVSNAIKFTQAGTVSVRVSALMEQDVDGKAGVLVRFEVQDTGIGISVEDQSRLFKEFSQVDRSFTRRFGGSGLGLAICRRLVLMMNGEIGVESQSGKGSKFWFMLPLGVPEASAIPERYETLDSGVETGMPAELVASKKILLVEDNDVNRMVAGRYLQKIGFTYDEARNGIEAIEKTKAKNYDLILMDVSMPEMDGMLATCHIRALEGHNARVPIIALTAHAMAGDRELCLAAGMSDYLSKPVEYNALVRAMERWLHLRIPAQVSAKPSLVPDEGAPATSPFCDIEGRPDFDPSYLGRMKEELGADTVRQVVEVFLENVQVRVHDLRDAIPQKVIDTAHFLKSSAANCGLMKFSYVMAKIEKTFAEQTPDMRAALIAEAQLAFEAGTNKLRRYYTDNFKAG